MEVSFAKDKKRQKNVFVETGKTVLEKIKNYRLPNSFYYFLILIVISVGFYMMMLVQNDFSLAYGGDYSAQYVPMGYHVWDYYHDWFRTGHFTLFDQDVFLGVNSFGSNAYYGLFSPFNIIIVLFPRAFVHQVMAITSFIKLACAGLFFSIYMRKAFKVKESVSFICGIAYAFAGWGAFYLWYNNYQDILVFFPLVLLGVEKTIQEKKPWVLALGVFFLAICNYVLMVPYIICAFLYAMFRFFQTVKTRDVKDNFTVLGLGVVGFMGGLLMSVFVFGPALMATVSSPKLDGNSYGGLLKEYLKNKDFKNFFSTLLSWNKVGDQHGYVIKERVLYPIFEFFFPATTCRSLPMMEISSWDFDDMAVSLWCYIPMIMFLVPALIQSGKEKKWSHYIGFVLILVSLFTPFMYFVTMGFTNGYARWTLFIATSLIAYVGVYLDKIPNAARWHIHLGYFFAIAGIVTAWLLTYKIKGHVVMMSNDNGTLSETNRTFIFRFEEEKTNYTNIAFIVELAYTTLVYLAFFFSYKKQKLFMIIATAFVSIEAMAMGNFVTYGHGYDGTHNNGYQENERFKNLLNKIEKNDKSFFRMYTSIGDAYSTNNGLLNGYGTGSFFHSLYNFEVNDFTLWSGMRNGDKSVGGMYRGKYQDLDNFLGVKYYVISKAKSKYYEIEKHNPNGYMANVPLDFTENKDYETNEYKVYENTKLNAFGVAYDTLYDGELDKSGTCWDIRCVQNPIVLSKAAVISQDDSKELAKHEDLAILKDKPTANLTFLNLNYHYAQKIYRLESDAKYYDLNSIVDIPNKYEPITEYVDGDTMKYFAFYSATSGGEPLFKAGTILYIRARFSGSKKYDFYFIGNDNKIFMMDAHDDDTTDNTSQIRGFYLTKDVYKMAVCGKYFESFVNNSSINIYSEFETKYHERWDKLNANPITDVQYTPDKFTFNTNYDKEKFVVSHVAYDVGWKLKATNNETKKTSNVKIYKGNGGFVSFIAPKGNYSYKLEYETPYLTISYLASSVSFVTYFVSMLAYHLYQEKKKRPHLDKLFREN